jgi:hypothetical protein
MGWKTNKGEKRNGGNGMKERIIRIIVGAVTVRCLRFLHACSTVLVKEGKFKKQSYPCNRPQRPIELWDVEVPIFF